MGYLKLLSAVLLVSVSGCMFQDVDAEDIAIAEKVCSNNGGVKHIMAIFDGVEDVVCRNGAAFSNVDNLKNKAP